MVLSCTKKLDWGSKSAHWRSSQYNKNHKAWKTVYSLRWENIWSVRLLTGEETCESWKKIVLFWSGIISAGTLNSQVKPAQISLRCGTWKTLLWWKTFACFYFSLIWKEHHVNAAFMSSKAIIQRKDDQNHLPTWFMHWKEINTFHYSLFPQFEEYKFVKFALLSSELCSVTGLKNFTEKSPAFES